MIPSVVDETRIESFRESAMEIHHKAMIPIRLLKFTEREVLEEYDVTHQ
jgi:hypothetical protein